MIQFGDSPPDDLTNQWRYQLDRFVQENSGSLAALSWGLLAEWGDSRDALGIDLQPQPHFVRCSRPAIEELNRKVDRKIQEILGILDGYNPQEEVAILAMSQGQIKLIHYRSEPTPPQCFDEKKQDLDSLIQELETIMSQQIKS
ncbi:hypothetical protein VB715_09665 [Crocosphaera sp. UHCC 0190]|uniref:beta-carboxysome assembly chaperone CcmS n=1 Tax=Crocosphaera sp. UHCC 0190 TaxID=3110246 RepID=UPI002B21C629|nr:hypothetical protein [Crocosphaera sp. UHCC 0190]MEA5510030.1 hypothetical protein [Crocosphaera sp. UHCC 0190]